MGMLFSGVVWKDSLGRGGGIDRRTEVIKGPWGIYADWVTGLLCGKFLPSILVNAVIYELEGNGDGETHL
jgi:hypothetical protein